MLLLPLLLLIVAGRAKPKETTQSNRRMDGLTRWRKLRSQERNSMASPCFPMRKCFLLAEATSCRKSCGETVLLKLSLLHSRRTTSPKRSTSGPWPVPTRSTCRSVAGERPIQSINQEVDRTGREGRRQEAPTDDQSKHSTRSSERRP